MTTTAKIVNQARTAVQQLTAAKASLVTVVEAIISLPAATSPAEKVERLMELAHLQVAQENVLDAIRRTAVIVDAYTGFFDEQAPAQRPYVNATAVLDY